MRIDKITSRIVDKPHRIRFPAASQLDIYDQSRWGTPAENTIHDMCQDSTRMQHPPGAKRSQNTTVSAFPSEPVAPDHPHRAQLEEGRGTKTPRTGIVYNFIALRREPEPCRTRPVMAPQRLYG
ncbi:hypothetical protein VTN77DRAFT_747 [Rasamsonia byssochlamydoides]|uniref:uncharacterized protein n=1 Tax=Rasamsonia byssochlamydoides TaxID=89139 RepID=UPI0037442002